MAWKRILVPIDFSDASFAALDLAAELAADSGASLTLLHVGVVPTVLGPETISLGGVDAGMLGQLQEDLRVVAQRRLTELLEESLPEGVAGTITVTEGYAPDRILAEAKDGEHHLIVMGTHGRTGPARALLGSVAERVIRKAKVPVLVTH